MTELPSTLIVDDLGGVCFVDRSKSQPNSSSSMVAWPLDPKVPTLCRFTPFDGTLAARW
jgi:hypothetical protein